MTEQLTGKTYSVEELEETGPQVGQPIMRHSGLVTLSKSDHWVVIPIQDQISFTEEDQEQSYIMEGARIYYLNNRWYTRQSNLEAKEHKDYPLSGSAPEGASWYFRDYNQAIKTHKDEILVYADVTMSGETIYKARVADGLRQTILETPSLDKLNEIIEDMRKKPTVLEILDQAGVIKYIDPIWRFRGHYGIRPLNEDERSRLAK